MLIIPIAKEVMQFDDELILISREIPTLEVGTQVINPAQPTTLPAPR